MLRGLSASGHSFSGRLPVAYSSRKKFLILRDGIIPEITEIARHYVKKN
jgi:hypothetical protein